MKTPPQANAAKSVGRQLWELAGALNAFVAQGFLREALLVRLCLGGLPLKQAVRLALHEICALDGELIATTTIETIGHGFDGFCRARGGPPMKRLVLSYVTKSNLAMTSSDGRAELDGAAFPSRKGGRPITPRTAERLLRDAWLAVCKSKPVTFRYGAKLGRMLRNAAGAKSLDGGESSAVAGVMKRINWLLYRSFPILHERQDAAQETALHLLREEMRRGRRLDAGDYALGLTIVRRVYGDRQRERRSLPTVPWGDLTWIAEPHPEADAVFCADQSALRYRIEEVLKTLTYREREILKLRFGMGDGYTYTLGEVGRIFKLSRERVSQLEARAIGKLQHPIRARKLEGFVREGECGGSLLGRATRGRRTG